MSGRIKYIFTAILCAALLMPSCAIPPGGVLRVAADTPLTGELAEAVGGEITDVLVLNDDGGQYSAGAEDTAKVRDADIYICNGLYTGNAGELLKAAETAGVPVIRLSDGINEDKLIITDGGGYDHRFWLDVSLWKKAAEYTAAKLSEADAPNKTIYYDNLSQYLNELDDLQAYVSDRLASVKKDRRILVTSSGSLRYFGTAYGFETVTLPENAGVGIEAIARYIGSKKIRAIFSEYGALDAVMAKLCAEVGKNGDEVPDVKSFYTDTPTGSIPSRGAYIRLIKTDADVIAGALGPDV